MSTCCRIKFLNRYMIIIPDFCIGAQKVFDFSLGGRPKESKYSFKPKANDYSLRYAGSFICRDVSGKFD